jgi:hypothetical protein
MAAMRDIRPGTNDGYTIAAINRALAAGYRVYEFGDYGPPVLLEFQAFDPEAKSWRPLFRKSLSLIRDGWDLRLDEANVEGTCKPCHDRESGGQGAAKVNRYRSSAG